MSMWEFEALAEECVKLVGASDWPLTDKRDAYGAIYDMVGMFDVSFIHFRTADILQAADFFMRVDLEDHPEYAARKAEFDAITAKGRSDWLSDAPLPEGQTYGGSAALYDPKGNGPHAAGIWFDPTMTFWQKAVDAGLINGLAATPLTPLALFLFITRLMTLADAGGAASYDVLKMLHGFVAYAVMSAETPPVAGDADLTPALALPNLTAALTAPRTKDNDWVDERFDARDAMEYAEGEQKAFLEWWCGPYGA